MQSISSFFARQNKNSKIPNMAPSGAHIPNHEFASIWPVKLGKTFFKKMVNKVRFGFGWLRRHLLESNFNWILNLELDARVSRIFTGACLQNWTRKLDPKKSKQRHSVLPEIRPKIAPLFFLISFEKKMFLMWNACFDIFLVNLKKWAWF